MTCNLGPEAGSWLGALCGTLAYHPQYLGRQRRIGQHPQARLGRPARGPVGLPWRCSGALHRAAAPNTPACGGATGWQLKISVTVITNLKVLFLRATASRMSALQRSAASTAAPPVALGASSGSRSPAQSSQLLALGSRDVTRSCMVVAGQPIKKQSRRVHGLIEGGPAQPASWMRKDLWPSHHQVLLGGGSCIKKAGQR